MGRKEMIMSTMVYCRGCGEEIHESAYSCPHCGATGLRKSPKSKVTAGLLALFIGGLGIHRFYLGQWWGIFYILFWISAIPSIISIIEGIVFLCTSDENWNQKYG
jgi:TM2 domain-containing membrane protein YozV